MKFALPKGRTLALVGVLGGMLAALVYVALRSGPLAPVPVTVAAAEERAITPALFGIGTIEARRSYRIGPTVAGRIQRVDVDVGDRVRAGQVLGEMDPVDLDDRIAALAAAIERAKSTVLAAQAQIQEATARAAYAEAQATRYEDLWRTRTASEVAVEAKRQDRRVAQAALAASRANLEAAGHELARNRSDHDGVTRQRATLRLVAPVDGLVVSRNAEPGTTLVAGQAVVEVIDPASLWISARFNQLHLSGLRAGLPARIVLRSRSGETIAGQVVRVEPVADAVTEETLAKVAFDVLPDILPPLGELAEITVALPALAAATVVPDASVQRVDGRLGVWVVGGATLRFVPVEVGAADLDGRVQVLAGLKAGARVVVYSLAALKAHSRITVVANLPGIAP
ncbi:MAG: efflux RND transporter periplasmic adaptor subunit [Acetobacteraceae bacterium]|nr:efflux RND transporter periplasmic adaptor subunit [Acetobacteraceae bacterium]